MASLTLLNSGILDIASVTVQSSEEISLPDAKIGDSISLNAFIHLVELTNLSSPEPELYISQIHGKNGTIGCVRVLSKVSDDEYVVSFGFAKNILLKLEVSKSLSTNQIIEFTGELSSET